MWGGVDCCNCVERVYTFGLWAATPIAPVPPWGLEAISISIRFEGLSTCLHNVSQAAAEKTQRVAH